MKNSLNIKITGAGVITSCGNGRSDFWQGLTEHRTGRRLVDDSDLRATVREMHLVDATECLSHSAAQLGLVASKQALAETVQNGSTVRIEEMALVVGTGMGEAARLDRARSAGTPSSSRMFTTAQEIAAALGTTGPVVSTSNACAASMYALGVACGILAAKEAKAVLVVGAEAYSRVALSAFNRMLALDPEGARPFEITRNGTFFGEAGGAVVIEPDDSSARSIALIKRLAFSCDAGHVTAPDGSGIQIRRTLAEVIGEDDIGGVVPHATGTRLNDEIEASLLNEMAGSVTPWLSIKDRIGHTGGASGLIGIIAALAMIENGDCPQSTEHGGWIPEAASHLSNTDVVSSPVVVSAYAFGGNNASVLIGESK